MNAPQTSIQPSQARGSWHSKNAVWLEAELHSLRLRLERRILWLRQQWTDDPLQSFQAQVVSDAQADRLLHPLRQADEIRFYEENETAAALTKALNGAETTARHLQQELIKSKRPAALDKLAYRFGLSELEKRILLVCAAPELEPGFERLYAYVHDDVRRGYASAHLVTSILAMPPLQAGADAGETAMLCRMALAPEAALLRNRLLSVESAVPTTAPWALHALRVDRRIVDYLHGVNRLDERVTAYLRPLEGGLLTPRQQRLADHLAGLFETMKAAKQQPPVVNLIGKPGVGKQLLAHQLFKGRHQRAFLLDVRKWPEPGDERDELLQLLVREAVLKRLGLYINLSEAEASDAPLQLLLGELEEALTSTLMIGSRERWQGENEWLPVPVPEADAGEQRLLWQQALSPQGNEVEADISALVEQFDLGAAAITRTVATAAARVTLDSFEAEDKLTSDGLWQAARDIAGRDVETLAQRIIPCFTWDDMVLPADVSRQLHELAAQVSHRTKVYEEWDFAAKLGRGRAINALFSGPSGTGKTMAAEVLANHLQLDLYRIDLAGVVSKYIGETEKNLRKVFDAAEQSGAILFFDEADALFGKRTEVKDSHDRYANIEINYLLQRMEDYRGLAILATNRKSALDTAFLRRLRFQVDFPFPRAESRKEIWQRVFPSTAPTNGVDYEQLAKLEISGGNIRNIALNAAFLAADNGELIDMDSVMQSASREYSKIEKLIGRNEFGVYYERVKS